VPETELARYYYTASPQWPYYTDLLQGEVYLPSVVLRGIKSPQVETRFAASKELGQHLIRESIRMLAYRVNPTPIGQLSLFPRIVMIQAVDAIFDNWEESIVKKYKDKKARRIFRRSKEEILQFLSPDRIRDGQAHYYAVGAQVLMYHSPAQSLMEAEFEAGKRFNEGTLFSLEELANNHFVISAAKYLGIELSEEDVRKPVSKTQQGVEEIHRILGLNDPDLKAKNIKYKKSRQGLFHFFIYSKIVQVYLESDDPRLNQLVYGELAD